MRRLALMECRRCWRFRVWRLDRWRCRLLKRLRLPLRVRLDRRVRCSVAIAAQKNNLLKAADKMPADQYQYKPTP